MKASCRNDMELSFLWTNVLLILAYCMFGYIFMERCYYKTYYIKNIQETWAK